MTKLQNIKAIKSEIEWCEQNPGETISSEYRRGFIYGLMQAVYIIKEIDKPKSYGKE